MKPVPRILPLIGVAMGGVLAVNALSGARELPDLVSGAKAFAEGRTPDKAAKAGAPAASAAASDTAARVPASPASARPPGACAPTAADLAKEAGLSPAELQVLQSLGARRGELDQREDNLNTQLALMAAAEAKLDAKVKTLTGLKADIQSLLTQTDQKQAAEIDRLVVVFEGMKPKDAAPRMALLDDSVRLPIAAKMKPRALSAILAQMPPEEAKKLTESLAKRLSDAKTMAANAANAANQAANQVATPPSAQAAAAPSEATADAQPDKAAATKSAGAKPAGKGRGRQAKAASAAAAAAPNG